PMLGVNDTSAALSWEVEAGTMVRPQQAIASLTTSKAVLELECESGGHLYQLTDSNAEVEIDQIIGLLHESASLSKEEVLALLPKKEE
ncbi:biotin/lipoyl-containing protein, partial [Acinetobacter baumannii]